MHTQHTPTQQVADLSKKHPGFASFLVDGDSFLSRARSDKLAAEAAVQEKQAACRVVQALVYRGDNGVNGGYRHLDPISTNKQCFLAAGLVGALKNNLSKAFCSGAGRGVSPLMFKKGLNKLEAGWLYNVEDDDCPQMPAKERHNFALVIEEYAALAGQTGNKVAFYCWAVTASDKKVTAANWHGAKGDTIVFINNSNERLVVDVAGSLKPLVHEETLYVDPFSMFTIDHAVSGKLRCYSVRPASHPYLAIVLGFDKAHTHTHSHTHTHTHTTGGGQLGG